MGVIHLTNVKILDSEILPNCSNTNKSPRALMREDSTAHYNSPPAELGRCPMALAGLCRDADIGRDLVDIALEGLSCLDTPAAEPGLTISTKQSNNS